jgi:hypothetical protein
MTSEELALLVFHLPREKFMDVRTFNLKRVTQFLLLFLNLKIVKMERSDLREKISEILMPIQGILFPRNVQSHSLHLLFLVNPRSPQI